MRCRCPCVVGEERGFGPVTMVRSALRQQGRVNAVGECKVANTKVQHFLSKVRRGGVNSNVCHFGQGDLLADCNIPGLALIVVAASVQGILCANSVAP